MKKKNLRGLSLLLASLAFLLIACGNNGQSSEETQQSNEAETSQSLASTGTLYLMLNPEIAIEYEEEGIVTTVRGENADGEKILENYTDYVGKHSRVVIQELILKLGEAGYFETEDADTPKQLVIELEAGSNLPEAHFLEEMAASAQRALEDYQIYREDQAQTAEETVDSETDQASEPQESPQTPATVSYGDQTFISLETAKQIAFEHAQVNANQVRMDSYDVDFDDGVALYELDFEVGPNAYEYEIHATSGEVLSFDHELETPPTDAPSSDFISLEEAKQIAFNHAGISGENAVFDDQELETDDGVTYYQLEFEIGEDEYEYDIHAVTGEILDYDIDLD